MKENIYKGHTPPVYTAGNSLRMRFLRVGGKIPLITTFQEVPYGKESYRLYQIANSGW